MNDRNFNFCLEILDGSCSKIDATPARATSQKMMVHFANGYAVQCAFRLTFEGIDLLSEIKNCTVCAKQLPLGAKPILSGNEKSKIGIVSQAPGRIAHLSGVPFQDPSGKNLREWLGVDEATFYKEDCFAIAPMGFCYPGKGKGGDLPPRPECAPMWHSKLFDFLAGLQLKLLIGQYAQNAYLGKRRKANLTQTVRNFEDYLPEYFPLPHPSPRNGIWMRQNPWFEKEVLPALKIEVKRILGY